MAQNIVVQELRKLGLSDKESKVYLASLELGYAPIQKISEKAGINRATTYVIMDQLIARGLAAHFNKGKKRYFAAESPDQLLGLLRIQEQEVLEKKREFQRILPELRSVYNLAEDKPKVMFFEGLKGLENIQDDFLSCKDKEIISIHNQDDVNKIFGENTEYSRRRKKLKIHVKTLYTAESGRKPQRHNKANLLEARHLPSDKFRFRSDITIYDNKIAIASLRDKLVGVIIENQNIADTFREVFELAWKGAESFGEKK